MNRQWQIALDEVAGELLKQADVERPPVDAFAMARKLNVDVAIDIGQQSRGRHKRLAGRPSIFLKPDERPERLQWAAAHELGEFVAHRVFERLNFCADEIEPAQREEVANLLASRLLLPRQWFFEDAQQRQWDILELKQIYRTASHELIAFRFLDLSEQSIVTIFDQGRMTRRQSNGCSKPPRLQPVEKECWEPVHLQNRSVELQESGLSVRGWPIHEDGWKREILRTAPTSEYGEWETD